MSPSSPKSGTTVAARLDALFNIVTKDKEDIKKQLNSVLTELSSIKKSQEFVSHKFDLMEKRLANNEVDVKFLKKENAALKQEIKQVQSQLIESKNNINNLEQYGRRDCLEIKGIAQNELENTDDIVVAVAKQTGVTITRDDINISHRLGKNLESSDKKHPKIIVKFISRKIRDSIYSNRAKLFKSNQSKSSINQIYINESLTKENRKLFYWCLQYKKNEGFKYLWTKNGVILLKKNDTGTTIVINKQEDLKVHNIPFTLKN